MVEEAMIDNFCTFYPLSTHFFKEHTILVEDEKRSTKQEETDNSNQRMLERHKLLRLRLLQLIIEDY